MTMPEFLTPVTTDSDALEVALLSHVGVVRQHNEDSIAGDAEMGVLVLADGMGGCRGGEVASALATGLVMKKLRAKLDTEGQAVCEQLWQAVSAANLAIYQTAEKFNQYEGMGTTLIAARFYGQQQLCIAHIGDSRMYRWRNGTLTQLTVDHTVLQEQIDGGLISPEEARLSFGRGLITRALGVEPEVDIDIIEQQAKADDIYLLCSDGLFDMVSEDDITRILGASVKGLALAAKALVDRANQRGGYDNISVVLAKVANHATGYG